MKSSVPQSAPRLLPSESHRVTGTPPSTGIFFSLSSAKNAIHLPSGEKIGVAASSVPGICTSSALSSFRTYSILSESPKRTRARLFPSGDSAMTPI